MDLAAFVFYAVAAVTLLASLGVVVARNVVYCALLLVLSLLLTGLVYLMLLSDFLALVQILIYGGTVSILLLFALMLTRPEARPSLNHRGWPLAAVGAVVLLAVLIYQSVASTWVPPVTPPVLRATGAAPASARSSTGAPGTAGSAVPTAVTTGALAGTTTTAVVPARVGPAELGGALFSFWAVPFEIASVVLLVSLLGSLLIARSAGERGRGFQPPRSAPPALPQPASPHS